MVCLPGKLSIAGEDTSTLAIGKNRSTTDLLSEGALYLMGAETYTRALTQETT